MNKERKPINPGDYIAFVGYASSITGNVYFCCDGTILYKYISSAFGSEKENEWVSFQKDGVRYSINRRQVVKVKRKKKVKDFKKRITSALNYCKGNTSQMWAASIAAILMDCDFRDANDDRIEKSIKELEVL